MTTVVILHAKRYDFQSEKTGEQIKGAKVTYFFADREDTDNKLGLEPVVSKCPFELISTFQHHGLPAVYEVDFRAKPGKDSKPDMSLVKAQFKRKLELFTDGE
jgi:hypothetical protein